jgi:16S rRNA (adenine1518-N6/adenine1519-N6)-dimethyltransferase
MFLEACPLVSEELFDVCDEHDQVVGQAPRSRVHSEKLLHRAVHIWIWNSRSELMIHLRSPSKDEYPGCYTSSASGHLSVGENYETAAHRELWEELRLRGELSFQVKLLGSVETAFEHTVLYFLTTDDRPSPDSEEIARIEFLPPSRIAAMVADNPNQFTPPFRSLMRWWTSQSTRVRQV